MISLFKYKRLYSTININDFIKVTDTLMKNQIDFTHRVKNLGYHKLFESHRRSKGTTSLDSDSIKEYIVYVNKSEYGKACNTFGLSDKFRW